VRIRIALTTAVAVIVTPVVLFALFSSTPAGSARITGHEAIGQHGAVKIHLKLMSYAEAQKVAKMATFYNAVTAHQEATYFADLAFFKAVAVQQQQQAAAQAAAAAATARAQAAAAAPAATPAPAPTAAPASAASDATSTNTADWACIREHESGDNYGEGGGGAYQFADGTWTSVTGSPGPAQSYPAATQDAAALSLYAQRGWAPWTTRYVCGL